MYKHVDPLIGHSRYKDGKLLAEGSFGFVYVYINVETTEHVAVKFLDRGAEVTKYVEGEILNHRILRHPHVIEFKEVFLTEDYICIAMEYASGGSLFQFVQKEGHLPEASARWFFQQLIMGIDYCHRKGVVNRDIKLENALLQPFDGILMPLLKICDFGYSKAHVQSAPKSTVGTLAYMAPEVVRGENYDGKLADIWSCGVVLYVMLFGRYPFDPPATNSGPAKPVSQRANAMMMRIMGMQWSVPDGIPISPDCLDLLGRMIVADPAQRISMAHMQQHTWFTTNLPAPALAMNEQCLANNNYSCVQSVECIKKLLNLVAEDSQLLERIIDDEIQGEVTNREAMDE